MKRGNDDEKIMGPMFPRLHVNDTDKGGPRAPPRNKMALYEQLSVPSQRYSIGSVSTNPNNNNNNNNNNNDLVSSTSASQGIVRERNMGFPFYQQPIPPSYDARHPETASLTNETTSAEKRKNPSEEDDFMVPSFSQPGVGQCKTQKNTDGERHTHQSCEGNTAVAENKPGEGASYMPSEVAPKDVHEVDEGMLRGRDDHLLERDNADKGNDASDTSMVDSVSGVDISPDDIVGVIGRKHFWKARTAIVNQQRVFAIQVFELHRLMKVQKLIAGSPHLLLEGSAFMSKTSMNNSPIKKYSSDYGVKPQAQAHTVKHKDNHQKPADKLEGTAENAVTKVLTQSQNVPQPTGYPSFSASGPTPMPMPMPMPVPLPPVNGADPKTNQWGFQQWLVPVMTPSEGLVYKLYPAPGMVGPMYGCGGGPSPEMGNMMNMPYMLPNPNYHPVPPGGQFGGQGCFPTYAMPPMNTSVSGSAVNQNQMNQFPGPNQYGCPTSQPKHQNSCNTPNQKHGSGTNPLEVTLPKEGEMLGSTASSPCERARSAARTGVGAPATKGTDTLCLFPTGPTLEVSEEDVATDKGSRVIKVVPHNAKSTRESATRIFRSIQAERRQHESS